MSNKNISSPIAKRFRGYLPVVVDVETGGLNPKTDALLEIAAVMIEMDEEGFLKMGETHSCHIEPFKSANLDPKALEVNKIDPGHPFRFAVSEKEGLQQIFQPIKKAIKKTGCQRAILVGHNPTFDLSFLLAAIKRTELKNCPFHSFTTFDTATLSGLIFGETVLSKAIKASGMEFDENEAHSAIYDAQKTAELFCIIVNRCKQLLN